MESEVRRKRYRVQLRVNLRKSLCWRRNSGDLVGGETSFLQLEQNHPPFIPANGPNPTMNRRCAPQIGQNCRSLFFLKKRDSNGMVPPYPACFEFFPSMMCKETSAAAPKVVSATPKAIMVNPGSIHRIMPNPTTARHTIFISSIV